LIAGFELKLMLMWQLPAGSSQWESGLQLLAVFLFMAMTLLQTIAPQRHFIALDCIC